jgi:hypothetical protein
MRTAILSGACALLLAAAGLADDAPKTATIKGTVTFDGKPLAEGKIAFHPAKGKAVTVPVKDGKYEAKDVPAGKLTVTVESVQVVQKDKEKVKVNLLPTKYADPKTSSLAVEVEAGKESFLDLDLR